MLDLAMVKWAVLHPYLLQLAPPDVGVQRNWVVETYLASALRDQGRPDEALPHYYRAAADMTRRDPEVYLGIATGEQRRGNLPLAIEYYQKALVVVDGPETRKQIFWNLAIAYRDLGDSANAQACFYQSAHQASTMAVDWQGDWWRQLLPMMRERLRHWRSGSLAPAPNQ
jgi:tetratricopeptide (TPR) repeat protein